MKCALPIYSIFILVYVLKKEHRCKDLEKIREVEEIYHGNIVDFEQHDLDRLSELELLQGFDVF